MTVESLAVSLKKEIKEFNAIKKRLAKRFKKDILTELKGEADAVGVAAIRWRQYTPYFNDGDECKFGVEDVYIRPTFDIMTDFSKELEKFCDYYKHREPQPSADYDTFDFGLGDYDDNFISEWSFRDGMTVAQEAKSFLNKIKSIFKIIDPIIMREVFGDHVMITVNFETMYLDVEDYAHD